MLVILNMIIMLFSMITKKNLVIIFKKFLWKIVLLIRLKDILAKDGLLELLRVKMMLLLQLKNYLNFWAEEMLVKVRMIGKKKLDMIVTLLLIHQ